MKKQANRKAIVISAVLRALILAVVKALVEQNGGTIRAESTVGQGTAFAVHLPVPA